MTDPEKIARWLRTRISIKQLAIIGLVFVPDALAISAAAAIAYTWRFDSTALTLNDIPAIASFGYKNVLILLVAGWIATLVLSGCYKSNHSNIFVFNQRMVLRQSIIYFFAIGFISFLLGASFSRSIFLITLNGGLVLLLLIRIVIHVFIMKPLISSKALATPLMIIGRDKKDLELHADWLMNNRHLGFKIASQMVCTKIDFIWVEDFDRQIRDTGAPEVLLLPGMESDKNFSKFINYLADLDIHVNWIPLDSGNLGYWQIPSAQEGIPFLTFEVSRISFAQRFVKRLFDIIFSTIVLVCISPFLALISIVIMVTDGRPVFYSQTRIGKNGKSFKFIKFRSMIRGAEEIVDTVENVHGSGHVLFKNRRDPRVTPIGRILRKYSLDELPQFWNVLKNNMSVVGPRPALPREVNIYSSIYERRLMAKPGITGPWQISGRSDLDLQTSIALDLNYMTNWSFFHDLWIIISTVKVMVNGRGAY